MPRLRKARSRAGRTELRLGVGAHRQKVLRLQTRVDTCQAPDGGVVAHVSRHACLGRLTTFSFFRMTVSLARALSVTALPRRYHERLTLEQAKYFFICRLILFIRERFHRPGVVVTSAIYQRPAEAARRWRIYRLHTLHPVVHRCRRECQHGLRSPYRPCCRARLLAFLLVLPWRGAFAQPYATGWSVRRAVSLMSISARPRIIISNTFQSKPRAHSLERTILQDHDFDSVRWKTIPSLLNRLPASPPPADIGAHRCVWHADKQQY